MQRNRRIVIISHCILNQNVVLKDWERSEGPFRSVVIPLLEKGVSLVQLPCPELGFKRGAGIDIGVNRPPMSYDDYNTQAYREHCRDILKPTIQMLKALVSDGCIFEELIGIENSPSCDWHPGKGVFMEEFISLWQSEVGPLSLIRRMGLIPEVFRD